MKTRELTQKLVQLPEVVIPKERISSVGVTPKDRIASVKDRTLSQAVESTRRDRTKSYRTRGEIERSRALLKSQKSSGAIESIPVVDSLGENSNQDGLEVGRVNKKFSVSLEKENTKQLYHIMRDKSIYLEPLIEVCMFTNMVSVFFSTK